MSVAISSKSTSETRAQTSRRKAAKSTDVSEDEIRILAYSLYERRRQDGDEGDATADWVEAERQLRKE
jgi:hypothetical protein